MREIKNVRPKSIYSQYGEEAYIEFIFKEIGTTNKYFVDIGANDGKRFSNTRFLLKKCCGKKWTGLMIDGAFENELVKKHFITRENVKEILEKYNTPKEFDFLSIDIDGNDYWILDELLKHYSPRVIISEYNSEVPVDWSVAIEYDPNFRFQTNIYYGYSFLAGKKLAERYGYKIIHQTSNLNLYMVKKDLCEDVEVRHSQFKWWGGDNG